MLERVEGVIDVLHQEEKPRGWRVWKIDWHNDGHGLMVPRLFSPQQKMLWHPGVNHAYCSNQKEMKEDHPSYHTSPQLYCNCGFYSIKDIGDIGDWGFGTDLPYIAGRLELSGTIIQASKGWISEFSRIAELHAIDSRCYAATEAHKDFLSMRSKLCSCSSVTSAHNEFSLPVDQETVAQVAEFYGVSLETTKRETCACPGCKSVVSMKKVGKRRYDKETTSYKMKVK